MNIFKSPTATGERWKGDRRAFTLVELLTIIVTLAILAAVVLPGATTSRDRIAQVQCASNLRQIGVGISLYTADADGYVPICGWPQGQNPWQTYPAARVVPGTTNLTRGYMNLGLLFRTKTIPDAKRLYCPCTSGLNPNFSYDYYSTVSNTWPSTPVGSGDDEVRTGYTYYPQLRTTGNVGGVPLPTMVFSQVQLEFHDTPTVSLMSYKLVDLNPEKSIATDLVHNLRISHQYNTTIFGLNALFPDGHVNFQNPRNNPEPFQVWALYEGPSSNNVIGNDGAPSKTWRTVMNSWKP